MVNFPLIKFPFSSNSIALNFMLDILTHYLNVLFFTLVIFHPLVAKWNDALCNAFLLSYGNLNVVFGIFLSLNVAIYQVPDGNLILFFSLMFYFLLCS